MITIVDYGMGNLGSIKNMLKRSGVESLISSDPEIIKEAKKIILPGVGAFDRAMKRIDESGLRPILDYKALKEKVPVLGICLGMQLLTESSEEGILPGLGWISGNTVQFSKTIGIKVPHMGWNEVKVDHFSELTRDFDEEMRFYFVHSYFVQVKNPCSSILKTSYGLTFTSAIQKENIYGVQFHPEKSHRFGKKLLLNFARL